MERRRVIGMRLQIKDLLKAVGQCSLLTDGQRFQGAMQKDKTVAIVSGQKPLS
jgi:hypothetical protein